MRLPWETVLEAAMKLSENERLNLASRLLESLPHNHAGISLDEDTLVEELDRRFANPDEGVEWSDLRRELPP